MNRHVEILLGSLAHVFLPKKTPVQEQSNLSEIEDFILLRVSQSVLSSTIDTSSPLTFEQPFPMLKTWTDLQTSINLKNPTDFVEKFTNAVGKHGPETISIYVKSQNCTVIFEREDEQFRMETYRSSLPTVMEGDLIMSYPETSKMVRNTELLQSKVFAMALYELSTETVGLFSAPAEPLLVNDFLSGLLCAGNKIKADENFSKIFKKVHDQMTLNPGANPKGIPPFCRSGIWMSVKVALQLKLDRLIENKKASKALYKLLILRIVTEFCKMYYEVRDEIQMDLDLMAQILANIGQRVCKLQDTFKAIDNDLEENNRSSIFDKINKFEEETFKMVHEVVDKVKNFMNDCIFKKDEDANEGNWLPRRSAQEYLEDLDHHIEFQFPDVQNGLAPKEPTKNLEKPKNVRWRSISGAAAKTTDSLRIWLHDTETHLKTDLKSTFDSETILKLACDYLESAQEAYQSNPLGISQIFLCFLKTFEELDRRAVRRYPILLKYQSGVKLEYFENLILPYKGDLDLLDESLNYFHTRNGGASENETIFPEVITPSSLAVKFVEENEEIRERLKAIKVKVEKHIKHKLITVQNIRDDCKNIQNCYLEQPPCEFDYGSNCNCWTDYVRKEVVKKTESVLIYEKPLPVEDYQQKAVLFELYCPQEISILREALLILQKGLLKDPDFSFLLKAEELKVNWEKYETYRGYLDKPVHSPSQFVSFGSSSASNGQVNFLKKNKNILLAADEDFIVENGLKLEYSFSFVNLKVETRPSFKIPFQMVNWEAYATLQKYLEGWTHTQNEVICGQNECHSDLSLEEFKAFGSIRAGHRIQLRNLYRALASNILSLEEEPVLALLIQTVWQIGPRKERRWESHEDFCDNDGFSLEFLILLENIVKTNENNYAHPCILIGAVAIAVRIMELNRATLHKGKKLLKEWRALMTTWRGKVKESLKKEDSKMDLEKNLLLINVCFALSYNLSKEIVWEMFRNGEGDLAGWFHTVNYFYEIKDYKCSLSPFMKLFYDLGRDVALKLKLEEKDLSSPFYFKWVKRFVAEKWSKAGECHEPEMVKVENKNILELKYKSKEGQMSNIVTFDLILGRFLVNGYPPGQLPKEVTRNKTFLNYFGESNKKLAVQQESDCVFRTIDEFQGSHYEFSLLRGASPESSELLVKQIQHDEEFILLEPSILDGAMQDNFIKEYYHWFHPDSGVIDFKRKINLGSENDRVEYRLIKNQLNIERNTWRFYDEANKAYLLSVNSKGFKNLAAFLSSFERKEFINVLVDKGDPEGVTVLLPRYNLRFKVDLLRCLLQSVEYPGYAVTGPVDVSTLVGLQQGIQLLNGEKRVLLIPNGDIHLEDAGYHHNTVISLDKLGSPAYFKFECDEVLRRFVGNSKVAYLYLAALHAVTSLTSGQPDPFTGLTGTEMAVRILQSGFIWSSIPYDEDCLKMLKFIEGLSPKRRTYGEGEEEIKLGEEIIEVIEWPKILPSLSAYDGFELIVGKLISDSEGLQVLHGKEKNEDVREEPSSLRIRAYFKYLNYYNSAAKLDLVQLDLPPPTLKKSILKTKSRYFLSQLQNISNVRHLSSPQSLELFQPDSLIPFLHARTPKPILWKVPSWHSSLTLLLKNIGLREDWFWLYKMASKKEKTPEEVQTFTLILSVLAYRGFSIQQVINLHYLSVFTSRLELPNVPECFPLIQKRYILTTDPSQTEIDNYFGRMLKKEWTSKSSNPNANISEENYSKCLPEMRKYWSACPKCGPGFSDATYSIKSHTGLTTLHIKDALNAAADQVNRWHCQKNFREFVQTVQDQLNQAHELSENDPIPTLEDNSEVKVILKPDLEKYGSGRDFNNEARKLLDLTVPNNYFLWSVRMIYDKEESLDEFEIGAGLFVYYTKRSKLMQKAHEIMKVFQSGEFGGKILQCTSIYPRTDPVSLLWTFLQLKHSPDKKSNQVCILIGALAMIWAQIKRLSRCENFSFTKQVTELERELENIPHENWNPSEYPEWLCLELELDVTIRSRQVEVAKRMLSMPGGNGVMQLNMGEGKTSVIVPMLCSVLGEEDNIRVTSCRVTILASMFNTNYKILSFAIGGILNKRVYVVPCRREIKIDEDSAKRIQESYEECLKLKGVVLALPEHRLSFRVLAYDKLLKGNIQLGLKLWGIEKWLQMKVRNVLDESDEILNAKYQLVYTVSGKVELDGGDLRWICCQTLLHILKGMGPELSQKFKNYVEFDKEKCQEVPHEFPGIRFRNLGEDVKAKITSEVADELLKKEGFVLGRSEVVKVKEFLTHGAANEQEIQKFIQMFEDSRQLNKIFIYSGYLQRGILSLGLEKRWRVEYGVDYEKTQRLMAVPFRAKDFPVERTEFGHPDLAILLTHLSYYYSGLSKKEMDEVMKLLRSKSDADSIYRLWIEQVPDQQIPGHLKSLRGINFKDSEQLEILYKLLRRHTLVINFWLSKKVFPRECKQFPSKLVMSSWDLCNEMNAFPTTGFSGTNDSSVLLPLQITQQDLPSLLDTNEKMKKTLIKPENKGHRYFKAGATCKEILEQMTKDGVKVLIDAGALMLDKNNEEVAKLWLKINPDLEGVLFFNKKNDLTVKCRGSGGEDVDIPLELSPYHGRLEKVGVFLDDQHTRGTDLKFPNDWRAVVTVGAGMKRDKLTQACMRMRKLGQEQSVSFYLSQEVFDKIKGSLNTVDISSKGILKFVEENTRKFNEDGLVHWAIGGRNYAQRLLAEEIFLNSIVEDEKEMGKYAELLARRCVDEEITSLEGMYGKHSTLDRLANVIPNWFEAVLKKVPEDEEELDFSEFYRNFERIRDEIVARCEFHAPNKLYFSSGENMEEEQEKELEMEEEKETEMEEEVVMEKPEKLKPALHNLHPNVSNFVEKGEPLKVQDGIVKLCEIFKETNFANILQPDAWDGNVFASKDFITVTKEEDYFTDEYLRPVEYFAAVRTPTGTQVLLLSSFEVNEMMKLFKNVDIPTTLHMFSIRRSEKQRLLLDNQGLTLPKGSVPTPLKEMSLSALLLASGNLYFGSGREQKAFAEFLCLAPKPWTDEEEKGCEDKEITKTGFMAPGYVKRRDCKGGSKGFSDDPSELVRRILECRHSVLNEISHVVRLLNEKKLIDFK